MKSMIRPAVAGAAALTLLSAPALAAAAPAAPAAAGDGLVVVRPGDHVTDDAGRTCLVTRIGAEVPSAAAEAEWHERNLASASLWTIGVCGEDSPLPMLRIMGASIYEEYLQERIPGQPANPFHDIEADGPYVTAMGTRAYKDGAPVGYIGNTGAGVSYMTLDYRLARYEGPAEVADD